MTLEDLRASLAAPVKLRMNTNLTVNAAKFFESVKSPRQFLPRIYEDTWVAGTIPDPTFGGVTAYMQAPAEGVWEDEEGKVRQDRVVILEVMTPDLDRAWWARYKRQLEKRFRQDAIVIRASAIETL